MTFNRFAFYGDVTSKLHITDPLLGESTGDQWIPLTKGQ